MKKELLAVLLAVAMAVPVFAAKGDMSVDAKLGLGLGSSVTCFSEDWNDGKIGSKFKIDMPFMLGAEFFYGLIDNLSVGVGVNYVFDTATKMYSDIKGGTTNIYLAANRISSASSTATSSSASPATSSRASSKESARTSSVRAAKIAATRAGAANAAVTVRAARRRDTLPPKRCVRAAW